MTNVNKDLREQLTADYEHALLRLAVHLAAEKEGEALLAERETLRQANAPGPSPAALRQLERQLDTQLRSQRQHLLRSAPRKIAVAVVAVCALFLTAMTTVQAFRARVLSLWIDIHPQTITFQLRETEESNDAGDLMINWAQAHVPTYIPDGYVEQRVEITRLRREIAYSNGEAQIQYLELVDSRNLTVNTEDASHIETVEINGSPGMLIADEEFITIIWAKAERMLVIQAQTDRPTALAVARGVKYIE